MAAPGTVRADVADEEEEGLVRLALAQKAQGIVGDDVAVPAAALDELTVNAVVAVARHSVPAQGIPVREARLRQIVAAAVPLAAQAAMIARRAQALRQGLLTGQGGLLRQRIALYCAARVDVVPEPVVDAVLRGQQAGEEGGARRRADRRGGEGVGHAQAAGGQVIQRGRV